MQQPLLNHPHHIGLCHYRLVTLGFWASNPWPFSHPQDMHCILQLMHQGAVMSVLCFSYFGGLTVERIGF